MITNTQTSFARNSRNLTVKQMRSEKYINLKRWTVVMFKSCSFRYWKLELFQTICHFMTYSSNNTEANFYWNRRAIRQCLELSKILMWKWLHLTWTLSQPSERQPGWDTVGTPANIVSLIRPLINNSGLCKKVVCYSTFSATVNISLNLLSTHLSQPVYIYI